MSNVPAECASAREWLSAYRDGEAPPDASAQEHVESCPGCTSWTEVADRLTRHARLRAPRPPAEVTARVTSLRPAPQGSQAESVGRALLAVAAVTGAIALVLGAMGIVGHYHLGTTDGRQAEALLVSLFGGFALAAWRPERLAAGLMPVAVLAAAMTVAVSVVELAAGSSKLLDELSHVPLVLGAVGTVVATRSTRSSRPPRPTRPGAGGRAARSRALPHATAS